MDIVSDLFEDHSGVLEQIMGIESMILRKVMDELGISQEMVDKVKGIIDNIDIQTYGDKTAIEISMKKITITIDK